jgi:hypothetical protein
MAHLKRTVNFMFDTVPPVATGRDHIPLQLTQSGSALALTVLERSSDQSPQNIPSRTTTGYTGKESLVVGGGEDGMQSGRLRMERVF